ncbi:hypothetical protein CRE_15204 [Caenorhabditis remanei]|uniref:Uncharacterized protein n=1 Tax=Caenorhabditis remanei TaxID=31234 RepID=E3NRS6_CAERE|nr:hypothetical protein CRE_15204 [Caenorhabditis remanei]
MSRDSNPSSLTILLLLVILVISISNYFTFILVISISNYFTFSKIVKSISNQMFTQFYLLQNTTSSHQPIQILPTSSVSTNQNPSKNCGKINC